MPPQNAALAALGRTVLHSPGFRGNRHEGNPSPWCFPSFCGRLSELSGGPDTAAMTLALHLALEAQKRGEPIAWVTSPHSSFFPPDAVETGVDLEAIIIIRVPTLHLALQATDLLLRSGGFGLVVIDLGPQSQLSLAAQSRLAGLARRHEVAVLCLSEKERDSSSLGSLVSLRLQARRAERSSNDSILSDATKRDGQRERNDSGRERFLCEAFALKDKQQGIGWRHAAAFRAPDGLR